MQGTIIGTRVRLSLNSPFFFFFIANFSLTQLLFESCLKPSIIQEWTNFGLQLQQVALADFIRIGQKKFRPIRFPFESRLERVKGIFQELLRLMYKCAECKLKILLLLIQFCARLAAGRPSQVPNVRFQIHADVHCIILHGTKWSDRICISIHDHIARISQSNKNC